MTTQRILRFRLLAPALLLLFLGCRKKDDAAEEIAVTVQAAHPTEAPISEEIAADAILAPLSQAAIASRISAPIRAEYVQRGSRVHKGQLLVTLEDRDLQGSALDSAGAVASAQANATATANATVPEERRKAETDVQQLTAARDVAVRTSKERTTLFQQGALSGRDADTASAAAVQAQAALDVARQHLESVLKTTGSTTTQTAQGQLQSARGRQIAANAQVSYASLRSPIDGVVTDRPLFPGETSTAGTALLTVMNTSSLLAKLHLAQATAQKLALGQKAEIHLPGVEEPVEAKVSFISPALDAGSTTVEIWLKLPNADGRFKVGTPVHAVVQGTTVRQALVIPPGAILPAQDGGTAVLVVEDGVAHKRSVKVGIRTADAVQVLSGVSPGDTVVTEGGYGLDDGTKVTVGKPSAADGAKD
ncbi:MAG: efflux RND transporter periplasmic adaptor subunit [Janthinobacterium lividum]